MTDAQPAAPAAVGPLSLAAANAILTQQRTNDSSQVLLSLGLMMLFLPERATGPAAETTNPLLPADIGSSASGSFGFDDAGSLAIAMAMFNAVTAQQQGATVLTATTSATCAALLSAVTSSASPADGAPEAPPQQDAAPAPVADGEVQANSIPGTGASGEARRLVALSSAIAIQAATDTLRAMASISTTAQGAAMAKFLATGNPTFLQAMFMAQEMMVLQTINFQAVGKAAVAVLDAFPSD